MVDQLPMGVGVPDEGRLLPTNEFATRRQRWLALAIAGGSFFLFVVSVPWAGITVAKVPAFVPSHDAALYFINLTTAALLFERASRLRSRALLVLASGYLFGALIAVPHALTFPGAFAPEGLLGAGPQTAAWLDAFRFGSLPIFVAAYAAMRGRNARKMERLLRRAGFAIMAAMTGVVALVIALTLFAVGGRWWLSSVMIGFDGTWPATAIAPSAWLLPLLAMLALWPRRQLTCDLWLMLVMWIWLLDAVLSTAVGTNRFELGWYAGHMFGLMAAILLPVVLLVEMAKSQAAAAAVPADPRPAETERPRGRFGPPPPAVGETEAFIRRQNIAHYRALLESGRLDATQRRSIERLLSEEEARQIVKPSPA